MLLDYKINYEEELFKNNGRKYTVQDYYLKSHNVDPCDRMTDDKAASNKLKREDCREERMALRFWPTYLYEIEMIPQGKRRQASFGNVHCISLIQISWLP
jgi:hypothetical protein